MLVYSTLFLLWCSHFLVDFMIAIFPIYKTLTGMELAHAGMIMSLGALGGELTQLFFGKWSDQGYRRAVLCLGVLLPCASICYVYCANPLWIFFCVLLTYVGSGAFHPAAAGLAASLKPNSKNLCVSFFASGGSLGLACGQLGFVLAYTHLGQAISLLIIPAVVISCLLLFSKLVPQTEKKTALTPASPSLWSLFSYPQMTWLYVLLVSNTTVYFGMMFLLPDLLIERGAPSWICFGGGHLAMVLGPALAMVPVGYLADRFGGRNVFIFLVLAALALLYFFLYQPNLSAPTTIVLLGLIGAVFGSVHPVGVAQANQSLPSHPGLVSAFAMGMVWCLSECLGPFTSFLTYAFPKEEAITSTLLCVSLLSFISLYAAYKLPRIMAPLSLSQTTPTQAVLS